MSKIDYDLKKIKGIVFDVDGVLSPSTIPLGNDGNPCRMVNTKDGYALQLAAKHGFKIAIITGADCNTIINRYASLGISDVYTKVSDKRPVLDTWMHQNSLTPDEIAYAGDDIPDYQCMKRVGLPVAPADAAADIHMIARYISTAIGGNGVARDLLEEILRAHGLWMSTPEAFGW